MPDEYDHLRESADKQSNEDFLEGMRHIFGKENVFVIGFEEPEFEELDSDDWKVLFMVLCENRGKLDLEKDLTPYGKQLLHNVQRKIGINAVGVDIDAARG